jgi:hypothetical protein
MNAGDAALKNLRNLTGQPEGVRIGADEGVPQDLTIGQVR